MFSSFSSKESSTGDAGVEEELVRSHPKSPQNLNSGAFEELHCGQSFSNLAPHSTQNFTPCGLLNWQFGHFIIVQAEYTMLGLLVETS